MKAKAKVNKTAARRPRKRSESKIIKWQLKLYIAGKTGRSQVALRTLREICEKYLSGRYNLEVIDLLKQPQLARGDQIFAIPTLIKKVPAPARKIIGDLLNVEKVLVGLDLREIGG